MDRVGAGEDHPVIRSGFALRALPGNGSRVAQSQIASSPGHDSDYRELDGIRAVLAEEVGQGAGLLAGAGDEDALADERARVEPAEPLTEANDLAYNGYRRCGESAPGHLLRGLGERG